MVLKMNLALQPYLAKALVAHFKCNEMSGTRIYNHAWDIYNTTAYIDLDDIEWVNYKDTIDN